MRIPLIDMAWDDRRRSFRAPRSAPSLSVPQLYFRWALAILGGGLALMLALLAVLAYLAATGG
jgi:hypothetical protein